MSSEYQDYMNANFGPEDIPTAEQAGKCQRFVGSAGYLVCDRCGSMWSPLLHGTGWLPLSCPERAALTAGHRHD